MYDVFLRKYICMYMFLVTLTHKIYQTLQTLQTHANPYPYPYPWLGVRVWRVRVGVQLKYPRVTPDNL
jgi:hypothetical protein